MRQARVAAAGTVYGVAQPGIPLSFHRPSVRVNGRATAVAFRDSEKQAEIGLGTGLQRDSPSSVSPLAWTS